MHAAATTNGWLEVMLDVMYPRRIEAGTWARLDTLDEMPMAWPCLPGSADRLIKLVIFAMVSPLTNVKNGIVGYRWIWCGVGTAK